MWKVLAFVLFSLFLFNATTKTYVNPYKLIMVFGKKGSGKTTYLTKQAVKAINKGIKVYSTVDIPGTYRFKVEDIGYFTFEPNSLVLIDEVGMIWDNRDFKKFRPEVRDFFKFQRQYKLKVILFSQTFDIDLKLRNLTDEMYLLKSFMRVFSICRRITKVITIGHNIEGNGQLVDDYQFAGLLAPHSISFTFIPRYVRFFNSYDPKQLPIINSDHLQLTDDQIADLRSVGWFKRYVVRSSKKFALSVLDRLSLYLRRLKEGRNRKK